MIRKTLKNTQAATYCIEIKNPKKHGATDPTGTGFFISPDGWFITAAHVIQRYGNNGRPLLDAENKPIVIDMDLLVLTKESRPPFDPQAPFPPELHRATTLHALFEGMDIALLKVDWELAKKSPHMRGKAGFPHLTISARTLEEGEPVYAFGYPLPGQTYEERKLTPESKTAELITSFNHLCPRTTSAIVASTMNRTEQVTYGDNVLRYTLDKALNYGNSGGPIVATETGYVHAVCSEFQPVYVPQGHLMSSSGQAPTIFIPSLYGIVANLGLEGMIRMFKERGIPIAEEPPTELKPMPQRSGSKAKRRR